MKVLFFCVPAVFWLLHRDLRCKNKYKIHNTELLLIIGSFVPAGGMCSALNTEGFILHTSWGLLRETVLVAHCCLSAQQRWKGFMGWQSSKRVFLLSKASAGQNWERFARSTSSPRFEVRCVCFSEQIRDFHFQLYHFQNSSTHAHLCMQWVVLVWCYLKPQILNSAYGLIGLGWMLSEFQFLRFWEKLFLMAMENRPPPSVCSCGISRKIYWLWGFWNLFL